MSGERRDMPQLPRELDGRYGMFRSAWRLQGLDGFITQERVVESNWYIFWLYLAGRWESLPFDTLEVSDDNVWVPLVGTIEVVAGAIGRSRVLYLVVEREIRTNRAVGDDTWLWLIYWKRGERFYLLSVQRTEGAFLGVV
jgi:hypothetical protein